MNTPKIKLHVFRKHSVELFSFETVRDTRVKVAEYTLAHIDGMQDALNQNEDVTEYDKSINYFDTKTPFECAKYNLDCDGTT